MKKLSLILGILFLAGKAHAIVKEEFNYIPYSSFTDVATPGTILFTSASINLVGVTIASGALNSYLVIYRSTSDAFGANVATQTLIDLNSNVSNFNNQFVPLFEAKNDSYTYINKVGTAKITIWTRCNQKMGGRAGNCPGLPTGGLREQKIEFLP